MPPPMIGHPVTRDHMTFVARGYEHQIYHDRPHYGVDVGHGDGLDAGEFYSDGHGNYYGPHSCTSADDGYGSGLGTVSGRNRGRLSCAFEGL